MGSLGKWLVWHSGNTITPEYGAAGNLEVTAHGPYPVCASLCELIQRTNGVPVLKLRENSRARYHSQSLLFACHTGSHRLLDTDRYIARAVRSSPRAYSGGAARFVPSSMALAKSASSCP